MIAWTIDDESRKIFFLRYNIFYKKNLFCGTILAVIGGDLSVVVTEVVRTLVKYYFTIEVS